MAHIPPCKWAQRKDRIFLTVDVSDSRDVKCEFAEKSVAISCTGRTVGKEGTFSHQLNLNQIIDCDGSTFKATPREIQINLKKKEDGFWDRLTEEPSKATKNFLTCNWDRWLDEDEADNGPVDFGYGDLGDMDYGGGDSDDDDDAPLDDLDAPPETEAGEPKAD
eukprot:TRINITY_DN4972_c0_g1_i2.p1 TRINITY_DN4972_c0_g1~~TRINITY_DN4972_c0_g1_i2.p1  ORF type:complete len:164 (+),score=37.25 TRINITY_DN4972_c0_g1_i2:64-555(+)